MTVLWTGLTIIAGVAAVSILARLAYLGLLRMFRS